MIEGIISVLQRIACIWLALLIIYPIANNKIMLEAKRNNSSYYHRSSATAARSPRTLLMPAFVTLALTSIDILLSIF